MREKILYDGFLKVKQVEHNGHTFEVISPKDAVMILYTDVKDCVHLVKQFRPAVGQDVIECPAGTIDRDAPPREIAISELEEELGITIRQEELQDAGTFFTNVGYDSQKIHLYTATGGTEGEQHLDPSEEIDILRIPFEKAMEMVKSRKIREVKTAYLLQREQWQRR